MSGMNVLFLLLFFVLSFSKTLSADIHGSEISVSVEPYREFVPESLINPNRMLAFGFFKNGFGLQDTTTTCSFESVFPVAGSVRMRGGRLWLGSDLIFQNPVELMSAGSIIGNDHIVDLSESVTSWNCQQPSIFNDAQLFFNTDLALSGTIKIFGDCLIDGRWNRLMLGEGASIIVEPDAVLHFRNVEIDGICAARIRCFDDSARIVLDNTRLVLCHDYTFTHGSITFLNEVNFVGPYSFLYDSPLTSTIDADSRLYLSDIINVTIGRKSGYYGREPLHFSDVTSEWRMENCSVDITSSGMRITNGTITCDGEVQFDIGSTSTTGGLIFGDGDVAHDIRLRLCPGAAFNITSGCLVDDVVDSGKILTGEVSKKFIKQNANSKFYVNQDLFFSNIEIKTSAQSVTNLRDGKSIFYSDCLFATDFADFYLTGTRLSSGYYTLNNGGELSLVKGTLPIPLIVRGAGNTVRGFGDIGNTITLHDHTTELHLRLDGALQESIVMNGGTIVLDRDLTFGQDIGLCGTGLVNLGTNKLTVDSADGAWTSTVRWQGSGSLIQFNGDCRLASEMKLTGTITMYGGFNKLHLADAGCIVIDRNSVVSMKNFTVTGLKDSKIRCIDDSGCLELVNVDVVFDGDFSFTTGRIHIENLVDFTGTASFFYESKSTSTIAANATWHFKNGMCLSIGRQDAATIREPLYFTDNSSRLFLDKCTLKITDNGMRLTRGTLEVNGSLLLDIASTDSLHGLTFGNGTVEDDLICDWSPGTVIKGMSGAFSHELTTMERSSIADAKLKCYPDFSVWFNCDTTLSGLALDFEQAWGQRGYHVAENKIIVFDQTKFIHPATEYTLMAYRYPDGCICVDGSDDYILASLGIVPYWILATGQGARIYGSGGFYPAIYLLEPTTVLNIGLTGQVFGDVNLGGGRVNLDEPLYFGGDQTMFQGNGTVNINYQWLYMESHDLNVTSTIYWDCDDGYIMPDSDMRLSSVWTISGVCSVLGTGKNAFIFNPTGQIVLERGATLYFKDVTVRGVKEGQIYCKDNSGTLIFDNVTWTQDADFTFSMGSIEIYNKLVMDGPNTTFSYCSNRQSAIQRRAELDLSQDFKFFYNPPSSDRNLFGFADGTGTLLLNGATLSSSCTGFQLTTGRVIVNGNCSLVSQAHNFAESIILGDGVDADNDLRIDILPESKLEIASGYVQYKNVL